MTTTPSILEIDWADLMIHNILGEGASGVISRGSWAVGANQSIEVAIKVFKGNVTSDGLPVDEMRSYIAAGTHPNLVKLLGKVVHHPEQKAGLVFTFVPPTYTVLGNPPSLETCTRDTYPPEATFSLPVILKIAQGIAAAAAHLHDKGISHGDLYAHNILANCDGESLLGDFGAASFYPANRPPIAQSLEGLEVRAFGCLLEDLLDRCVLDEVDAQTELRDRLRQLQWDCMNPTVSERPPFSKIGDLLAVLA